MDEAKERAAQDKRVANLEQAAIIMANAMQRSLALSADEVRKLAKLIGGK